MQKHTVTVYGFKKYNSQSDSQVASRYKATEEAIRRFEAVRIDGTGEEVEETQLDAEERYLPPS